MLKRAEQIGDNIPVRHQGPCVRHKWGHRPQCEQKNTKTCGLNERIGLVTSRMSTQTHAGEKKKKAPEPRKHTKQLSHQRAASKSRATYYHGP